MFCIPRFWHDSADPHLSLQTRFKRREAVLASAVFLGGPPTAPSKTPRGD